jgi:hypothetical protein
MSPSETEHGTRYVVRIEHQVHDFAAWKAAFDRDPVSREAGGVRRYRVMQPLDDPQYAMVDLEFDSSSQAATFCAGLQQLWRKVEGKLIEQPRVRIAQVHDFKEIR